jgi:hypothetical protein
MAPMAQGSVCTYTALSGVANVAQDKHAIETEILLVNETKLGASVVSCRRGGVINYR